MLINVGRLQQRFPSLRLRYIIFPALIWLITATVFIGSRHPQVRQRIFGNGSNIGHRMPPVTVSPPLPERIPCYGVRGKLLPDSPDDKLQYSNLSQIPYPVPFLGSQRELGIEQTWMTAEGRYGPYGFGEEKESYNRSKVNWRTVDWGMLQDQCFLRNAPRFPEESRSVQIKHDVRFKWKNQTTTSLTPSWSSFNTTRRTALVIRAYSSKVYTPEDLWNIRSLITETALATGGEYTVFLFVHVQDKEKNIFQSYENYVSAFENANIPSEFQSIAILWDDNLLESWYEAVEEHSTMWQVNQPFQLFALHYPEFDHYWQIELDQRFTGDAGKYLDAVATFARNEPRKQSLERATYPFDEKLYGTYDELIKQVDTANGGKTRAWGPLSIPDINPIGPKPLTERPEDDEHIWGVGEEADVVVTSFCADVCDSKWVFKDYTRGFKYGKKVPRYFCPPAIMRASRPLLLAVHQGQHDQGLSLPSEAVLPSWALWHGLKLSYPPQPVYMSPYDPEDADANDETSRDPNTWPTTTTTPWFGKNANESTNGLAHGNPQSGANRALTWWWTSIYPRKLMDMWLSGDVASEGMSEVLALHDGQVYMPNMGMHPVKT